MPSPFRISLPTFNIIDNPAEVQSSVINKPFVFDKSQCKTAEWIETQQFVKLLILLQHLNLYDIFSSSFQGYQ